MRSNKLSGYASEQTQTVSFDQAVEEIANAHFEGDLIEAEADLFAPLRDSTILAYKNGDVIRERRWRHKNPWVLTTGGEPGISRENTYLFRSCLQKLYDNTLWKKEISKEKNYRGKEYKNGVYFTLKTNKEGLDGQAKWSKLKEKTRDKWDRILTVAIKFAPEHPNSKHALGAKIAELNADVKNPERRLGEYFDNWNSPGDHPS